MERKVHFFAMDLPHSDACFVQAYPENAGSYQPENAVRLLG